MIKNDIHTKFQGFSNLEDFFCYILDNLEDFLSEEDSGFSVCFQVRKCFWTTSK